MKVVFLKDQWQDMDQTIGVFCATGNHRRWSIKIVFFKIFLNSQENTRARPQICSFIKKEALVQ